MSLVAHVNVATRNTVQNGGRGEGSLHVGPEALRLLSLLLLNNIRRDRLVVADRSPFKTLELRVYRLGAVQVQNFSF